MNNDSKLNSRRRDAGSRAAHAVEKLLERIAVSTESADSAAAPQIMAELTAMIEKVRQQYRALADRQVQAALEAALALEDDADQPPAAPSGASVKGDGDVLDALEALIHGEQEMFKAAAYSLRPPTPSLTPAATAPVDSAEEPVAVEEAKEETEQVLYEGTVRLQVYPGGSMQRVLRFVDEMGKRPQFRVLRMSGNPQREGAEIDLGLREPLPLLELLWDMGHAAEPADGKDDGIPGIVVHLYAAEVAKR